MLTNHETANNQEKNSLAIQCNPISQVESDGKQQQQQQRQHQHQQIRKPLKESCNWNRFSEWLHCICVVTFDLELGQAMEAIFPAHITLTEPEKNNICYLAFPDSNSGCMGDTQFHVRLRVAPSKNHTLLKQEQAKFNLNCHPVHKADQGHYWGFVYFRQIRDNSLKRGYLQKSIVLLSRLPFINLFYNVTSLVAPKYFKDGDIVLETTCAQICNWPTLNVGQTFNLAVLGTVYQMEIPMLNSKWTNVRQLSNDQNSNNYFNVGNENSDEDYVGSNANDNSDVAGEHTPNLIGNCPAQVLSSINEIDIFNSLYSVLSHIHLLWELVLTAEPIVVMGTSPTMCSHMVQSLMSLIAPLAYCAESRPYFTIHDSEFKEFTQLHKNPPPIILGVTNPFFAKTLQHWPHTIRLIESSATMMSSMPTSTNTKMSSAVENFVVNNCNDGLIDGQTFVADTIINRIHNQPKLKKIKNSSKLFDSSPGVYTQYKPFLQKDKNIIKKVLLGVKTKRPATVQSAILRRHMLELTQSFMIPLERYMASLMPLQKDISPFKAPPIPNQFKQDTFLASVETFGPQLTSSLKGDWIGLYKRFFRSSNFKGWYEHRYSELTQTLQTLQLQALSNADLKNWVKGKHEVEIVDMILRLNQKLKICEEAGENQLPGVTGHLGNETKQHLLTHLMDMKSLLPGDLKTLLDST